MRDIATMPKQLLFIPHSAILALAVMFAVTDHAAEAGETPQQPLKQRVLYNLDGDSCMWTKANGDVPTAVTVDDLKRLIDEINYDGSQVNTLLVGINARAMYYPTEAGTMRGALSTPAQRANWPAFEKQRFANMNGFFEAGIDPYAVILGEAKQQGLESMLSFRMNDVHGNDFLQTKFWNDNPGYRLGDGLDFWHEAVRDYTFSLIKEAVQRYDSDGIELDFNRSPTFFQDGTTEERIAKIDSMVQQVRTLLDEEGAKRDKHLILTARVPSNYGTSPPTYATSRAIGCDPVAWAENGWVDYLTVSEYLYEQGTLPIESWKESITEVPVYGGIEAIVPGGAYLTPEQYRLAARNLWEKGVDGIYLFNFFTTRQFGNEPPFEVLKDLKPLPLAEPTALTNIISCLAVYLLVSVYGFWKHSKKSSPGIA